MIKNSVIVTSQLATFAKNIEGSATLYLRLQFFETVNRKAVGSKKARPLKPKPQKFIKTGQLSQKTAGCLRRKLNLKYGT